MSQSTKRKAAAESTAAQLIRAAQTSAANDPLNSCGAGSSSPMEWGSAERNRQVYIHYLNWILDLAINRFRWEGLPESCNVRFLEWALLTNGTATICRENDTAPWLSLRSATRNVLNVYGEPLEWEAYGFPTPQDGRDKALFNVTSENGAFIYDSISWLNPWVSIQLFAADLTYIHLTEIQNLGHQRASLMFEASEEREMDVANVVKEYAGFEPGIVTYPDFLEEKDGLVTKVLTSGVPYLGQEIQVQKANKWNEVYRFLGIDHLAFEKGERMIEQEAEGNRRPTNIMLLNCLKARRIACEHLFDKFGLEINVVFNEDMESYDFYKPAEYMNGGGEGDDESPFADAT